jgi:hypothetical protein
MKRLILFSMVCLMATATQAQNDSIKNETLPEVVVNADAAPFKDISLGPKGRFPKERTPDDAGFPASQRLY